LAACRYCRDLLPVHRKLSGKPLRIPASTLARRAPSDFRVQMRAFSVRHQAGLSVLKRFPPPTWRLAWVRICSPGHSQGRCGAHAGCAGCRLGNVYRLGLVGDQEGVAAP